MRKTTQGTKSRFNLSRILCSLLAIVAMVVAGLVAGALHTPAAQAAGVLSCASGNFYSVGGSGSLNHVVNQGSNSTIFSIGSWNVGDANGLAIGANGTVAYAYDRNGAAGINSMLKYDSGTGRFTSIPGSKFSQPAAPGRTTNALVTGAVSLSTGMYMFGSFGFERTGRWPYVNTQHYFFLYQWNPNTNKFSTLGKVEANAGESNGDMAFDSAGNLYIVGSGSTTTIYTITAANLASANGGLIPRSATNSSQLSGMANVNGMAFESDGTVYLGNQTAAKRYDPSTNPWTEIETVKTSLSASTDLASCSSPANLTVKKNVVGRSDASDQFNLAVKNGSTTVSNANTQGNKTGIQDDQVGPVAVRTGNTYTVSEGMADGSASPMSSYTSTWQCIYNGSVVGQGNGTSGSVTMPNVGGAAVTCTFTNTPKPGGVTWAKADSSSGAMLAGSEWKISGPAGSSSPDMKVTDCVGGSAAACAGTNDANFQLGQFEVDGLTPGNYTLTETKAPVGYALLDPPSRPFTVKSNTAVDLGVIENTKLPVATLTVSKTLQDVNGANPKPASGWQMSAALSAGNPVGVGMSPAGLHGTSGDLGVTAPWTITYPNATAQASVNVAETQQDGYQFVSGGCTVKPTAGNSRTVVLNTAADNVISGINLGDTVSCNFINKPTPGSVTWEKVDQGDSSDHLSGSKWTLTGPGVPANTVVLDCAVSGSCASGAYSDQDARPGYFKLSGLAWGSYKLVETTAPAGYVTSKTSYPFTISATGLNASINGGVPVPNKQRTPPVLPLTGGLSSDAFVWGGAALVLLSAGLSVVWRRRMLRFV